MSWAAKRTRYPSKRMRCAAKRMTSRHTPTIMVFSRISVSHRTRQRKALNPSRITETLKNKNYHTFGNTHNGSRSLQVWHGHILFRTEITTYSPSTGISPDTKSLLVVFKRCSTDSTSKFASGIHAPHFEQTKLSNCTTSS